MCTDQVVEQRRVQDGGGVELLAGDGGADDREDSGADDRADAERGQRNWAEGLFQPPSGSSESEISLSMDLQQKSWFSERNARSVRSAGAGCASG